MVQTVYMYMHGIGEEKAVEEAIIKNNTKISVLAVCIVLCTLSDNTCACAHMWQCKVRWRCTYEMDMPYGGSWQLEMRG